MRPAALAALGVLAYGGFLAATLPASVVAGALERETRGAVRLVDCVGTLWSGSARAMVALPGTALAIDQLDWRFRPASLAAGRFGFELAAATAEMKAAGEVGRTWSGWAAREVKVQGTAQRLAGMVPLLAAWRPEGTLELLVPALAWSPDSLRGSARAEWRSAGLMLSEVKPLGAYRAELHGEGAQARIELTTLEGPLRVSGKGTLTPRGRFALQGEARAEGPQAPALQPLLDLLGPRRPDGSRTFGARLGAG